MVRPPLNSAIAPAVVTLPIAPAPKSANQRLPSGPGAIPIGSLPMRRPALNSVIAWVLGLIRPIAAVVPVSVNQRLPSGPGAIPFGLVPALSPALNSVIVPAGVIRPIASVVPALVNHRLPSGPGAIVSSWLPAPRPVLNSVIWPTGAAADALPADVARTSANALVTASFDLVSFAGSRCRIALPLSHYGGDRLLAGTPTPVGTASVSECAGSRQPRCHPEDDETPPLAAASSNGSDGTRTRGLRRDRPAL